MGLPLPGRKDGPPAAQGAANATPAPGVQAIAWAAQKRFSDRYTRLYHAGKPKCVVDTAIARELVGFIGAIACEVEGRGSLAPRGVA